MTNNTAVSKKRNTRKSTHNARVARRRASKVPGYVLFENPNIVVVATLNTSNPKTGPMIQLWILPRDIDPVTAVKLGLDDTVCFDCKHRGHNGKKRTCYVKVFQAPRSVWKAYQRGRYPYLKLDGYQTVFSGRKIRFGAYGEPILIPVSIVAELSRVSSGWTGYTHQWMHSEYQAYSRFFMASVDNVAEYEQAKALGWRTFRCRTADQPLGKYEIACPASDEMGHRTTCARCTLCDGLQPTGRDVRKDIAIIVHGSSSKSFVSITSLTAAAAATVTGFSKSEMSIINGAIYGIPELQ